ncbi:MAG: phosphotransferase-like protein [Aquihabitans sp.]
MTTSPGRVVFLFGTSSVGKTSTAVELQGLLDEPFVLLGLDTFFGAWPDRWSARGASEPAGFRYEGDDETLAIRCGPAGERLLAGIRAAVRALAVSGTDVIYDEMPIHRGVLPAWRGALADLPVLWVRLIGDLTEVEAREAARWKPRYRGLARGHAPLIEHQDWADLTLDSTDLTPQERAERIRDALAR